MKLLKDDLEIWKCYNLIIWLENKEKMNTYTISFPSSFCLRYAYSNYEKRRRLWGVSRMPIDQECKICGKTFRNKGYLYCSEDCQLRDKNWNNPRDANR